MSTDPAGGPTGPQAGPQGAPSPSEEELRAAYEAELSRITSSDIMLQASVSLLNIAGRRLGLVPERTEGEAGDPTPGGSGPERDLEQVRDAIDGAKGLLEVLERTMPRELGPLRDALSQLQMAYAREVSAVPAAPPAGPASPGDPAVGEPAAPGAPAQGPPDEDRGPGEQRPEAPGPAESSGRLWVPGR